MKKLKRRPNEGGFTLVELLIVVVLLGGITGAIATTLITSLNAHSTTRERLNESNDAPFISA